MIQYIEHIDLFLGDPQDRYFAEGFRHFDTTIHVTEIDQFSFKGTIQYRYDGPVRPREEPVHIGSIEYLATALYVGKIALTRLHHLSITGLDSALLHALEMQLKQPLYIQSETEVPFSCQMLSSDLTSEASHGRLSRFLLQIGPTQIRFTIDHTGRVIRDHYDKNYFLLAQSREELYPTAYRKQLLKVQHLWIEEPATSISSHYAVFTPSPAQPTGIGSAREHILPTDCLRVFGQMMQALLFRLMETDRANCANIWLRKMELHFARPHFALQGKGDMHIVKQHTVTAKGKSWQVIDLSGTVGHCAGNFSVAHQSEPL